MAVVLNNEMFFKLNALLFFPTSSSLTKKLRHQKIFFLRIFSFHFYIIKYFNAKCAIRRKSQEISLSILQRRDAALLLYMTKRRKTSIAEEKREHLMQYYDEMTLKVVSLSSSLSLKSHCCCCDRKKV